MAFRLIFIDFSCCIYDFASRPAYAAKAQSVAKVASGSRRLFFWPFIRMGLVIRWCFRGTFPISSCNVSFLQKELQDS